MSDDEMAKLDYRDWRADARQQRNRYVAQAIGAAIFSGLVVVFLVFAWAIAGLQIPDPPPRRPPRPYPWHVPATLTLVGLGLLLAIGIYAYRKRERGIVAGLLIGIGVAALVEGICFVSIMK